MARLEYPDLSGGSEERRVLAAQIAAERGGKLLNLYRMLLHSEPVAAGWLRYLTAIRQGAKLDDHTRELAICKVGKLNGALYEWEHHIPHALRAGITRQQLEAIDAWRGSGLFDDRERAVLAYSEQMTKQVEVDDEVFAAVRRHFDDQELVELTATIGAYNMVSRFLVALRVDLD